MERTESFKPVSAVTQPRMMITDCNDREVVRCECGLLLDRKERYRKAAALKPSTKPTIGHRNSVPEAVSTSEPIGRQRSQPTRLSECDRANVATHDGALAGQFDCRELRTSSSSGRTRRKGKATAPRLSRPGRGRVLHRGQTFLLPPQFDWNLNAPSKPKSTRQQLLLWDIHRRELQRHVCADLRKQFQVQIDCLLADAKT